jgi:hypothetical protein
MADAILQVLSLSNILILYKLDVTYNYTKKLTIDHIVVNHVYCTIVYITKRKNLPYKTKKKAATITIKATAIVLAELTVTSPPVYCTSASAL